MDLNSQKKRTKLYLKKRNKGRKECYNIFTIVLINIASLMQLDEPVGNVHQRV